MIILTIRYLFRDEVEEFKKVVGKDLSDPLKSSEETTSNFINRKIIDTSPPSSPDAGIWKQLKTCDFVCEYYVPCPHCSQKQVLIFPQIKFTKPEEEKTFSAHYECLRCKKKILNIRKHSMLESGEWRARITDNPTEDIPYDRICAIENTISLDELLDMPMAKKVGFHLPKWYSPFIDVSFEK